MNPVQRVTLAAPAKVNLGLEILSSRRDGFHEIRTVMAMVSLCDTLTVAPRGAITTAPVDGVDDHENLISRALTVYRTHRPRSPLLGWTVEKRIPMAAGLGGASSDAAAALRAANSFCPPPLDIHQLHELAAALGGDVPFFLSGPTAVARGRGIEVESIVAPRLGLLLIVPRVELVRKTGLLYSLLQAQDFSNGSRVEEVIASLASGRQPSNDMLRNAFARALCAQIPRVRQLQDVLEREIDLPWGLSGAGPCHYVIAPLSRHDNIRNCLESRFPGWLRLFSVTTLEAMPAPVLEPVERT